MATRPNEHGTNAGYERHRKAGEKPCDDCRRAHNAYTVAWRRQNSGNPEYQAMRNRYDNARARALSRLRQAHLDEYDKYLREELRR